MSSQSAHEVTGANGDPKAAVGADNVPTIDLDAAKPGPCGRYLRKSFHARGGMGEVWLSQDNAIGRDIALKVLRHDSESAKARFLAEAQITGQLEHPNIVPVHDFGMDDEGHPYYVMKFVRGRTLKQAIAEYHAPGPKAAGDRELERVRLLHVFVDLCHAVAYAHSRGVLHRDVKPDNVMLGPYGETLVLDWGIAKVVGQPEGGGISGGGVSGQTNSIRSVSGGASSATSEGTVLGTASYMPPEMAEGLASKTDERSDVYLLGATLYEILTGKMPRQASSREDMLELARTVPPPPARRLHRQCPRAVEAIAVKAMAHRQEDRYVGAMELAEGQLVVAVDGGANSPQLFADLGAVQDRLGRAAEAVKAYSKSLQFAPGNPKVLMMRAVAYTRLKRCDDASADFTEVSRLDPGNARAHGWLGYVLAVKGSRDAPAREAVEALTAVADDFVIVHHAACIFAERAHSAGAQGAEDLNVTMILLHRAIAIWKTRISGPNEGTNIRDNSLSDLRQFSPRIFVILDRSPIQPTFERDCHFTALQFRFRMR